jgi:cytochrome o ubiquinol oxidase subunit 2
VRRRPTWLLPFILAASVVVVLAVLISRGTVELLSPAGTIAEHERNLIIFATLLSSVVIIPVFGLTAWIVWRYRATNLHAAYDPQWDHNRLIEGIWWLIPSILIAILAAVAWRSSHTLDPRVAIQSDQPTLNVQVVALQWKWLFIYPDQNVATVNKLMLPVNRAVHFDITADAPMNSFWIPQLGGQIYAMPGMSTQLNLEASKPGHFRGSSANISGTGFASMQFDTQAVPSGMFNDWAAKTRDESGNLNMAGYNALRRPGTSPVLGYGHVQAGLYDSVLERFMSGHNHMEMGTSS